MLFPPAVPKALTRWVNIPRLILAAQIVSLGVLTLMFVSLTCYVVLPFQPLSRFGMSLLLLVLLGIVVLAATLVLALLDRHFQDETVDSTATVFEELRQLALTSATARPRVDPGQM